MPDTNIPTNLVGTDFSEAGIIAAFKGKPLIWVDADGNLGMDTGKTATAENKKTNGKKETSAQEPNEKQA
jgi:hypothetical protein